MKGNPLRKDASNLADICNELKRKFQVSNLVVLRRLLDLEYLTKECFETAWQEEMKSIRKHEGKSSTREGGDYYATTVKSRSRRFTQALITDTLEGKTLYRDALGMLNISKMETFHTLRDKLA